ncbi:MAG: hypothetical protein HWN66_05575 [Candidatus Helarchaeota archaeon]|nr:hypothetical protein [Candidatus Helarchaeota archaeon]
MKDYLSAVITEQKNRGLYLKQMIPNPLQYPELSGLAVSCGRIIDENIKYLEFLQSEIKSQHSEDFRSILRGIRACTRDLELVESYGITPLNYQPEEKEYLNRLVFKIHQEINYPLPHPAVACISTQYYFFSPFTNVIFIPFGESEFLLHLPDMFHELGHGIYLKRENELRLSELNQKYNLIINEITEHYQKLLSEAKRETGPKSRIFLIKLMHSNWKNWIDEFLCDLFALFTLGPAYVYTHLHLATKTSKDIYKFSSMIPQTHPSDDSRMKMLMIGLKLIGLDAEIDDVSSKWHAMPFVSGLHPSSDYYYAYPKTLMEKVASLLLQGLKETNFPIMTRAVLKNLEHRSVRRLLNEAWDKFWENPNKYREWELDRIKKLRQNYYFIS